MRAVLLAGDVRRWHMVLVFLSCWGSSFCVLLWSGGRVSTISLTLPQRFSVRMPCARCLRVCCERQGLNLYDFLC